MSERTRAAMAGPLLRAVPDAGVATVLAGYEPRLGLVDLSCGVLDAGTALAMLQRDEVSAAIAARHVADRDVCLRFAADERFIVVHELVSSARTHPDAVLEVLRRFVVLDERRGHPRCSDLVWDKSNPGALVLSAAATLPPRMWLEELEGGGRLLDAYPGAGGVLVDRALAGLGADDAAWLIERAPARIAAAVIASAVEGRCELDRHQARALCEHRWSQVFEQVLYYCSRVDVGLAEWAVTCDKSWPQNAELDFRPHARVFDAEASKMVCDAVRTALAEGGDHEHTMGLMTWLVRGSHHVEQLLDIQEVVLPADYKRGQKWLAQIFAYGLTANEAEVPDALFGPAADWVLNVARGNIEEGVCWSLLCGPVRFAGPVRVGLARLLDFEYTVLWLNGVARNNTPGPGEATEVLLGVYEDDERDKVSEMRSELVRSLEDTYQWVFEPWRDELLELCGEALFDHLADLKVVGLGDPSAVAYAAAAYMTEAFGSDQASWHTALTMAEHWHTSLPELCDTVKTLRAGQPSR